MSTHDSNSKFNSLRSAESLTYNAFKFNQEFTRSTQIQKAPIKTGAPGSKPGNTVKPGGIDTKMVSTASNFSDYKKITASSGAITTPSSVNMKKAVAPTTTTTTPLNQTPASSQTAGTNSKPGNKDTAKSQATPKVKEDSPAGSLHHQTSGELGKVTNGHTIKGTGAANSATGGKKPATGHGTTGTSKSGKGTSKKEEALDEDGGSGEDLEEDDGNNHQKGLANPVSINVYSIMGGGKDPRIGNTISPTKK